MSSSAIEFLGKDQDQNRDLYLVEATEPTEVMIPKLAAGKYFTAIIAWDAAGVPDELILQFARGLINEGAVYFCVWGEDCERVHDLIDLAWVGDGVDPVSDETVMTSWHDNEPLTEALWFAVNVAFPIDQYFDECRSVIGICIGCPSQAQVIRHAFTEIEQFHERTLGAKNGNNTSIDT
jgi:hypothetical protein